MSSAMLARAKFFDANPVFLIEGVDPFTYGRAAEVNAREGFVRWFDGREHLIGVRDVGESTSSKLVILDDSGRRFAFVPLDLDRWNEVHPKHKAASLEALRDRLLSEPSW